MSLISEARRQELGKDALDQQRGSIQAANRVQADIKQRIDALKQIKSAAETELGSDSAADVQSVIDSIKSEIKATADQIKANVDAM